MLTASVPNFKTPAQPPHINPAAAPILRMSSSTARSKPLPAPPQTDAEAAQPAVPVASSATTAASLLTDPLLSAFLAEDFSPTVYLNRSLPAYSPHYHQAKTSSSSSHKAAPSSSSLSSQHAPSNSLQTLHSAASSLLSELDVNLNRLQATLSGLTDDILRVTPRLGYEVEVLRSDVLTVAETLASEEVETLIQTLAVPAATEADEEDEDELGDTKPTKVNGVTDAPAVKQKGNEDEMKNKESLLRLRMLVQVRDHLEDVIKIFGDAMEWTLSDAQMAALMAGATGGAASSSSSYAPPVTTTPPIVNGTAAGVVGASSGKISGSEKIEHDISYLITSNELQKASQRVEEISKLLAVWLHTPEYSVRSKFVDGLRWKVLEASKEEELAEEEAADTVDDDPIGGGGSGTAGTGRDGYYSLINQLRGMRGI